MKKNVPARPAAATRRSSRKSGLRSVLALPDAEKGPVNDLIPDLKAWFEKRAGKVVVERDVREFYKRSADDRRGGEKSDLVVVLGGDGAILAAVRAFAEDPVQTIGINFGRVGF